MPTRDPWETNPAGRIYMCAKICAAAFDFFSHGTRDLYPTFLQVQHNLSLRTVGAIALVCNIGAPPGRDLPAALRQWRSRRRPEPRRRRSAAVMMGQAHLQGRIARGEQNSKLIREARKHAAHFFGRRIRTNSLAPAFKPARGFSLSKVCGVRPK
jgi:hypothetical protein